ncbi:MAG: tetratricopeptide repeat protein [Flammeovirgaceae bacterium]
MKYVVLAFSIVCFAGGCALSEKPTTFIINGKQIDFYGLDRKDFKSNLAFNFTEEARLLFQNKQMEKAKSKLREGLRLEPNNIYILQTLAIVETHSGESQRAIKSLKKVLAINPAFYDCYLNLSICYLNLEKYDSTIIQCDFLIKAQKTDRDLASAAYLNKSVAKMNTGKVLESLECANKALELCENKDGCSYALDYRNYVKRIVRQKELKELFQHD